MTELLRLHYAPDNASLIVRLALEELGLAYETVLVDRSTNAQASSQYLSLNPNGSIPVLETQDGPIFETAAILLWLGDRTGHLVPSLNDPLRAPFLKWMFWCSNTFQADLRVFFYPHKFIGERPEDQLKLRFVFQKRLENDLAIIDDGLAVTDGLTSTCDAGTPATLLDLYLPCLLRWTKLYADLPERENKCGWFDLQAYPRLYQICAIAENRASTHAAQVSEGLGPTPFTAPRLAIPPEGSAT